MSSFWTGFMNFVQVASFFLFIALAVLLVIVASAVSRANRKINRLKRRYDALFRGEDDLDIEALLNDHSKEIEQNTKTIGKMIREQQDIRTKLGFAVQKLGFVKFNAFDDLTNELSFCLVLLDSYDNGIMLTSIYGREQSTTFTKIIKQGKSSVELSKHEKEALDLALEK